MIFATGDTHGNFERFGTKHFPEQKEMSRSDHVIICGGQALYYTVRRRQP